MNKILFLYENNSPSAELTKRHYELWRDIICPQAEIKYRNDATIKEEDINWADVLIVIRGLSPFEKYVCDIAQKRGVYVVLHIDDDMLSPPDGYIQLSQRTNALRDILKNADAVVTNPYLKDKYLNYNKAKNIILTDTPIKKDSIVIKNETGALKKIVYPAGRDHAILFERYVKPALQSLPKGLAAKIQVDCIGNAPNLDGIHDIKINLIPHMSMQEYENFMRLQSYDIGLAPLDITEFCKGKYYNKFINFAQYGIVGIYTNVEPYTYVVQNGVTGLLADNDWQSWAKVLREAIIDESKMKSIRENQYRLLIEKFSPEAIIHKYDDDLPKLKTHCSNNKAVKISFKAKMNRRMFILKEKAFFFCLRLKKEGIKATIKRIKNYISQKRSYGEL